MSRLFSGVSGSIAKVAALIGVAGFVASTSLYTVQPGHRAIIFDRIKGIKEGVVEKEGIHVMVPVLERPIIMDARVQPRSISTVTGTRDLQEVNLSLRMLTRPQAEKLPEIYRRLGMDYSDRVLPSLGNEVLKAVVAQYNADQLLTLRDKVSQEIRLALSQRCADFNIICEDVSITHLDFSRDFSKAIEDKQVAEQNAERAKFVVQKAEQEKLALIIRSEGDSEAAELVSQAVKKAGPGLIELRKIETAKDVALALTQNPNVTYLPGGQQILLGAK